MKADDMDKMEETATKGAGAMKPDQTQKTEEMDPKGVGAMKTDNRDKIKQEGAQTMQTNKIIKLHETARKGVGQMKPKGEPVNTGEMDEIEETDEFEGPSPLVEEYFDSECTKCPLCGKDGLMSGSIESEPMSGWADVECRTCGGTWREVWMVIDLVDVLDGEGRVIQK